MYSFLENNIKMNEISRIISIDLAKYSSAKLNKENDKNLISSDKLIEIIENSLDDRKNKNYLSSLVKDCLKILLFEENDNNLIYFVNLILREKLEDIFYNAIKQIYETNVVGANYKREIYLVKSMILIADINLFIYCDQKSAKKWYELIKQCKFHIEVENYCKENLNIDYNGFFNYISKNDPKRKDIQLLIVIYSDEKSSYYDSSIETIDLIYKYYFSINQKINDLKEARGIFIEMLSIVNETIVPILINTRKLSISKNNIENVMDLLYASNNNDFVSYIPLLKEDKTSAYNQITIIAESIELINKIKKELLVNREDKIKLAYYTKLDSFSFMLPYKNKDNKSGMLPLMNISYMNDPTEGTILYKYLKIEKEKIKRESISLPYIYIKSFTSSIDYLPMWEMYAEKGTGICVVLDWNRISKQHVELYRICYVNVTNQKKPKIIGGNNKNLEVKYIESNLKRISEIRDLLDENIQGIFDRSLQKISYLFKDDHYCNEKETRIIISDDKYKQDTYRTVKEEKEIDINNCPYLYKYAEFVPYIKEIIVGPKYKNIDYNLPFIKSQIEMMCELIGTNVPQITYSDIDYR